jgi:acyl transferase domain-containing protein
MAGRFPGAHSVDEFWDNLCAARESISRFSPEQLAAAGVSPGLRDNKNYVPARGVVGGVDLLDADYFGMSPREAEITDPQQRSFLECAEEALQNSGYDSARLVQAVGVFAGCTQSSYRPLVEALTDRLELSEIDLRISCEPDFLATRVAYKLGLTGPAVTIQTACSTGLVAIHSACQSILNGECSMAVAGAASIQYPEQVGYLYVQGSIGSPDGHCRAFDADAAGTVSGNGCGAVVLKGLSAALRDRDPVRAIVIGSAINNDGALKVGFTAPSVHGQRDVIGLARAVAGVDGSDIGYIETHGTGTQLGDPVEIEALGQAAQGRTHCRLGSVKPNIGHLDAAAGVAGFIKAALVLERGVIPPTLHFKTMNPNAPAGDGEFEVVAELTEWPADHAGPRRAGVSSFGVGGTNAHAVLQEHFPPPPTDEGTSWQVLPISASSTQILPRYYETIRHHLAARPALPLADAAYTLQVGRRELKYRAAVIAPDRATAAVPLTGIDPALVVTGTSRWGSAPGLAFTFPGQGTEFRGMAADLAAREPTFRSHLEETLSVFTAEVADSVREFILGVPGQDADAIDTALAQACLFATQYALARTWMSWGVQPSVLLGHSIGEITAAAVSGVFGVAEAAWLVEQRGAAMSAAARGQMRAITASADAVAPLLGPELSIAAVNGDHATVIGGPAGAMEALTAKLKDAGMRSTLLRTRHAFHSAGMDQAGAVLAAAATRISPGRPRIPFLSCVTGDWIRDEQATDPAYWGAQLRQTVQFAGGCRRMLATAPDAIIEVGAGRTMTALVRDLLPADGDGPLLVATMPERSAGIPGHAAIAKAAAQLWANGAPLDWEAMRAGRGWRRVQMPGYLFSRQRYSVLPLAEPAADDKADDSSPALPAPSHRRPELATRFRQPNAGPETVIVRLVGDLLGIDEVGADDSFLDLGGDSLLAIRLLARVNEIFGTEVTAEDFFAAPTVCGLAILVERLLTQLVENLDPAEVSALLADINKNK